MSTAAEPIQSRGPVIEADALRKRYGSVTAVDGVSFSVASGEIFGMLGPNGAGKTTTLEMLEGLRIPDGGRATVLGEDIVTNARHIKARVGVQLQATALPALTKVREAVELFASFYPTPRSPDEVLAEFDLTEKADAMASKLSGGQMQRLSLALAVINNPDLIFLDEPTTGLDPQARLNMWAIIGKLRAGGRTVIMTTHYMEEAERLCDRIAVMDAGTIVALDTPARLIRQHAPGTTIEFDAPDGADADALRKLPGVESVAIDGRVSLRTTNAEQVLRAVLDPAAGWTSQGTGAEHAGVTVRDLRVHQGTLEDVFLNLTGRKFRE